MKIRHGFVSNSSSSSYLIALPKDFTIEKAFSKENINNVRKDVENSEGWQRKYHLEALEKLDNIKTLENAKEYLEYFFETGYVTSSDPYVDDDEDDEDDTAQEVLSALLNQYIIEELPGGSDMPSWYILVDKTRSKDNLDEILEKRKKSKEKKKKEREKAEIDPNYNPEDYPNETNGEDILTQFTQNLLHGSKPIQTQHNIIDPNNPDKRTIRKAKENIE